MNYGKPLISNIQGGKRMMAGGAEKCSCDSGRIRSGESGGNFLAILVFQLVLTTFVKTQKRSDLKNDPNGLKNG